MSAAEVVGVVVTTQQVPVAAGGRSLADIAERLMAEFGALLEVSTISRVVLACRGDLVGSASIAVSERFEHHARELLVQAMANTERRGPAGTPRPAGPRTAAPSVWAMSADAGRR